MAELGNKFPALGGVDRLRLVERAWGQGYRWWVRAARALQAQAVAAFERRQLSETENAPSGPGASVQEQDRDTVPTRRRLPQRVASPVIQVTATGEIAVAGIDPPQGQTPPGRQHHAHQKHRRRQPHRVSGKEVDSARRLQNVYGDQATVSQLRHVSVVARW